MPIIVEERPKTKGTAQEEHRLQGRIVIDHAARCPQRKDHLIATFQEVETPQEGARKKTLGLVAGVSDLLYFDHEVTGIEVKHPFTNHKVDHVRRQANWLLSVPNRGFFCDSVEMFWEIIERRGGIDPRKVLSYLETIKDKSFTWDNKNFL